MPPIATPLMLRDRIAALSPRERLFLAAGAAALLAFLLYMLLPSDEESGVELAASPPVAAPPPPLPAPLPIQPVAVAQPPVSNVSALSGVVLRGVMGGGPRGGAGVFDAAGGTQRVVRVGREIVPGVVLREIGVRHAIASTGSGDVRLDLNTAGGTVLASAPAPAQAPVVPAMTRSALASIPRETMQYRLGLRPVQSGGRVTGYAVKPGAPLPHFGNAGLQPGDVIVGVNGSAFDAERLTELSWAIANSSQTEFEFLRGGKRMKATLSGQPPQR